MYHFFAYFLNSIIIIISAKKTVELISLEHIMHQKLYIKEASRSAHPNHLNLPKLTGSSSSSSLHSALFYIHFNVNQTVLTLFLSNLTSCSTLTSQESLPYIKHLTQLVYSSPFCFNNNPFPNKTVR